MPAIMFPQDARARPTGIRWRVVPIIDGQEADADGRERSALLLKAYLSLSIANGVSALERTTDPREQARIEGHLETINRTLYEDLLEAFSPDVIEAVMNLAGAAASASDRGVARHRRTRSANAKRTAEKDARRKLIVKLCGEHGRAFDERGLSGWLARKMESKKEASKEEAVRQAALDALARKIRSDLKIILDVST
jgi:hypothetical protein